MSIIVSQRFSLHRFLLLSIGLWPYKRTKFVRFQILLLFGIVMSFIMFQLTTFLTAQLSVNFVIKILSAASLFAICMIVYTTFWINPQPVKCSLEYLQQICNELKDENEIAILEKYGYTATRYTINITLLAIFSVVFVIIHPFWPYFINLLPFINGSQSCYSAPIITEYFIDQEKYFYIILLHMDAAVCVWAIIMVAAGTFFVVLLEHACGMFMIASYRIQQAMTNNMLKNINWENEIFIYKRITNAVDIHRQAMRFAEFVINNFEGMFIFLIIAGVLCLSFNLFCVMSFENGFEEMFLHFIFGTLIFVSMFITNYFGQEVIDHNDYVYYTAYNVRWYVASLHVQKLILFLLQRGNKSFSLTIGKLFTPSMKNFVTLASASVSYFTVMHSIQQT